MRLNDERDKGHDRDQQTKYVVASLSSFNHGWRNYRFVFPISRLHLRDFFFCKASPSLRCLSVPHLLRPPLRHVPRDILNILPSPFFSLSLFHGILPISFRSVLSASHRPWRSPRLLFLPPLHPRIGFPASFVSRSFFLGLPVSSWSFSFVITGNTRVRGPPRARDSTQRSAS